MKKIIVLLFVFIGVLSCSESNKDATPEPVTEMTESKVDSLGWINSEIIKNPNNPDLYLAKARYFSGTNNIKQSIEEVNRALSIDSTNVQYYIFKADVLYDANELVEAKEVYTKAIELEEHNIHSNIQLAWISLVAGRHESCFEYANNALKENQYLAEPYYLKGLAYKELGNFKLSVSNFRTAAEQNNDFIEAWLQLGYMYDAAEDTLAGAYYENALRVDSNNIDALYAFGMHLQKWGITDEAITQYQHILRVNVAYHDAYYNIGYIYLEMIHQNDSAIKYYDKVLALNPYNFKGYYNRGLAFERNEQPELAKQDFEKTLELKPDYTPAAKGMGRVTGIK